MQILSSPRLTITGGLDILRGNTCQALVPTPVTAEERHGPITMTVTNVKYAIYLRSTPSEASDANIIMEIPVGSKVTYLDTPNNTFYKISYGGTVGYSKQIYLTFD